MLKVIRHNKMQAGSVDLPLTGQVIGPGMGSAYLRNKFRDQNRALQMIKEDSALQDLRVLTSPMVDLEVRGVPALQYFGGVVWGSAIEEFTSGFTLPVY